jgi:hypothetical protein
MSLMAAIVAGLTAAATPAAATEKAIWGPLRMPDGSNAFQLYQRLGVDTFQIQLDFAKAAPAQPTEPRNPNDPAYRWPNELDDAINQASQRGIRVAILVNRAPSWANHGNGPTWVPQPKHFAAFVAAASRRYPSVRRWMIWGEPNKSQRFQPAGPSAGAAPRAYARVLDAAYGALKGVSRRNVVIGGMTWTGGEVKPAQFLSWLKLPSGRRPRLDWYGHNPFPFRFPRLRSALLPGGWRDISDVDVFAREVARAFPGRPKLWLSEFTIQSGNSSNIFQLSVSRKQQARWLAAAYRIAGRVHAVSGLGWIGLLDQPPAPGSSNWGLMTHDGTPKPALSAFRRALRPPRRP